MEKEVENKIKSLREVYPDSSIKVYLKNNADDKFNSLVATVMNEGVELSSFEVPLNKAEYSSREEYRNMAVFAISMCIDALGVEPAGQTGRHSSKVQDTEKKGPKVKAAESGEAKSVKTEATVAEVEVAQQAVEEINEEITGADKADTETAEEAEDDDILNDTEAADDDESGEEEVVYDSANSKEAESGADRDVNDIMRQLYENSENAVWYGYSENDFLASLDQPYRDAFGHIVDYSQYKGMTMMELEGINESCINWMATVPKLARGLSKADVRAAKDIVEFRKKNPLHK